MQLKGGMPTTQVRDLAIQKRESDLVVGAFGRGVFVLDDYSALRELTPQALTEAGRLFPLRDAYLFDELAAGGSGVGQRGDAEPALRRADHLQRRRRPPAADAKLVLTVTNEARPRGAAHGAAALTPVCTASSGTCAAIRLPPARTAAAGGRGAEPAARQAEGDEEQEQEQPQGVRAGTSAGTSGARRALPGDAGAAWSARRSRRSAPPQTFAVIPLPR